MGKGKRPYELTPDIEKQILAFVRAGAFPHVACEAAGIPREVFERWMEIGCPTNRDRKKWQPHKQYTPFWHAVMQAKAQARLTAEMQTLKNDPITWLQRGPGKEKINDAGWSLPTRPITVNQNNQVNVLLSPEMQSIFAAILQVLAPYPEARAAVASALAEAQAPRMLPKPIEVIHERDHLNSREECDGQPPPESEASREDA